MFSTKCLYALNPSAPILYSHSCFSSRLSALVFQNRLFHCLIPLIRHSDLKPETIKPFFRISNVQIYVRRSQKRFGKNQSSNYVLSFESLKPFLRYENVQSYVKRSQKRFCKHWTGFPRGFVFWDSTIPFSSKMRFPNFFVHPDANRTTTYHFRHLYNLLYKIILLYHERYNPIFHKNEFWNVLQKTVVFALRVLFSIESYGIIKKKPRRSVF